jgi:hypothetical protein
LLFLALGVEMLFAAASDLRLVAALVVVGVGPFEAGGGGVRDGDRDSGDGEDWAVVPFVRAGSSLAALCDVAVMGEDEVMEWGNGETTMWSKRDASRSAYLA